MWGGCSPPNLPILFWSTFAHFGTTVVFFGVESVWPLHIPIRFRNVQKYQRTCLNVHPTSLIQDKFLFFFFQQDISVTGHVIPIFLTAQNYIANVLTVKTPTLPSRFLLSNLHLWNLKLTHFVINNQSINQYCDLRNKSNCLNTVFASMCGGS